MSFKSLSRYKHIIFVFLLLMVMSISYFLLAAHAQWQDLKGLAESWRAFAKRGENNAFPNTLPGIETNERTFSDSENNNGDVFIPTLNVTSRRNMPEFPIADGKNITNQTKCPDGHVYYSNDLYDCDGIMKDARFKKINTTLLEMVVPETIKKETFTISSNTRHPDENKSAITQKISGRETQKKARHIFVNCGGTFPKTIELFLDTYPKSSSYFMYTFILETSFTIMYSQFPNHTVIPFEASFKNSSKNVDIKAFGADADTTQTVKQIDLASWLKAKVREEDFVIVRIDSEDEVTILEHVIKSDAMKHIDKYYSARGFNESKQELKSLMKTLRQMKLKTFLWDNNLETYSDFFLLNPNHIPVPGKRITLCQQKKDDEKFALLLYSPSASVNSIKVINLLHNFSPEDRLHLTIFLPYYAFKLGTFINMNLLFSTFHVGMFYDGEVSLQENEILQYNKLRNKLLFVRRLFDQHGQILEYVLTGNNTNEKVTARVRKNLHYSFVQGGKDISRLTEKTLAGKTFTIDDTGKAKGDFLLVNIDTINAEYLVLYMVRRFAPWLLTISQCDLTSSGTLLHNK